MSLTSYSHQIVGWILLISFIVSIVVGIIGYAIMKYEGATTTHSFSHHRKYYKTPQYTAKAEEEPIIEEYKEILGFGSNKPKEKPKVDTEALKIKDEPRPNMEPKYKSYLTWECAYCGQTNKSDQLSCPHCLAVKRVKEKIS